jgi:hypothetical protein
MLALLLVAPCLLGQLRGEVVGSVKTEARGRPSYSASQGPLAADAELSPAASLDLSQGSWRLFTRYAANIRLNEPYAGGATNVLHYGSLSGDWRPTPVDRVLANVQASYGVADFYDPASLTAVGPQPLQPATLPVESVPFHLSARILDVSGSLGADLALSARARLGLTGRYGVNGALDAPARDLLPVRRGPDLRVWLGVEASPNDGLDTEAWAAHADFSTGSAASLVQLDERWRHKLSTQTDLRVTLGGAGIRAQPVAESARWAGVPVGTVDVTHRQTVKENRLELTFMAGVVPFIDRFAATGYERLESSGELLVVHRQQVRLTARAGAAYNLTGGTLAGGRALVLDLLASYDFDRTPDPQWRVEAFFHTTGNRAQLSDGPLQFMWATGLAATFRTSGVF